MGLKVIDGTPTAMSKYIRKQEDNTRTRHNCTLEGKFEFIDIAITKNTKDKIRCIICGRTWEEV